MALDARMECARCHQLFPGYVALAIGLCVDCALILTKKERLECATGWLYSTDGVEFLPEVT